MQNPGPYEAIVLADSIASGVRLTTLCVTMPRIVLAEFNTHRVFSRNSASSRAIPVEKRIAQIRENPYVPLEFGANQRGMQAKTEEVDDPLIAREAWLSARDVACDAAARMAFFGVHKQWANRLLEPFGWTTVIVSATEWVNFWALRISEHAQPEIRKVAEAMKAAMDASTPDALEPGCWHLPLVEQAEMGYGKFIDGFEDLPKLSVSRCAAVSYERHLDHDVEKDLARYERLREAGHMSPFEHAAVVGESWSGGYYHQHGAASDTPATYFTGSFIGNFRAPWIQHRKLLPGEAVFGSAS